MCMLGVHVCVRAAYMVMLTDNIQARVFQCVKLRYNHCIGPKHNFWLQAGSHVWALVSILLVFCRSADH